MRKILFLFLILLIAFPAVADDKVYGHMAPLNSEKLPQTISLDCGARIVEWQGKVDKAAVAKMNKLCDIAVANFEPFLRSRSLDKKHHFPFFAYEISLLIRGNDYRQLNDYTYRFNGRNSIQKLIAYYGWTADHNVFIMNDTNHPEFDITFVHELFHAQSFFYGLYYTHHESNNNIRSRVDEQLARSFENYVRHQL